MTEEPHEVRVVDAPLVTPSADQGLLEVLRRRYLLKLLVRREISARYQGSFLGLLWSYINPLAQFLIFYFIMGKLVGLGDRTENFAIHVFAALIVVHFFTETFNAGTRSIVRNKAIVKKMAMPREMFPVASMLVSLFHVLPQMVILLIACAWTGWTPDPVGLAAGLLGLSIVMVLGTALALLFSAANVFFRDFSSAVSVLTNFVRFSVPMIYPYELVSTRFAGYEGLYLANPIADAVLLFQRGFWVGTTDDRDATIASSLPEDLYTRGLIALGASVIVLVIGQLVFTRLENRIPERL
ncbi:MAG: ABC transporter permease [Nocardioidaceae bacterium]